MQPGPAGSGPTADQSAQALATLGRLSYLRDQAQHRALTEDEQAELEQERPCTHCGGHHVRSCPRVKRIAFHPGSGQISEVEYFAAADIDWTGVVFEDVGGDEEVDEIPVDDIRTLMMVADGSLKRDASVTQVARRVNAWLGSVKL